MTQSKEVLTETAKALENVGLFYGDILFTCARIFSSLKLIEDTRVEFDKKSDLIVGGLDSDGKPVVHLGLKGLLTQQIRDRLVRRIELPVDPVSKYDDLFRRVIFGHELGHVLQADERYSEIFGQIDRTTYVPEEDYLRYVNSDKEANADYVAASILGNSALGTQLEYSPPVQTPEKWREWAETRRIK